MSNFDKALNNVFFVEGGYSDHREDKGGKTKYGITERTYNSYVRSTTERDVWPALKDIDEKIAAEIYRRMYWDKIRGDELPRGVSLMVFDSAVHAGPATAIRWLQRAVGTKVDGILGPNTLRAVSGANRFSATHMPILVVNGIAVSRLMLARENETFVIGWFNRIIHILAASVKEIVAPPPD